MSELTIYEVLASVQQSLNVPKGRSNKGLNFSYRNCDDILSAVKPLLPKGYSIVVRDKVVGHGDRFYIEATASLTGFGQSVEATGYAREPNKLAVMQEPQVTGACSSYARKYALNGLLAIDNGLDVDSLEAPNHNGNGQAPIKFPSDDHKILHNYLSNNPKAQQVFEGWSKARNKGLMELTQAEAEKSLDELREHLKKTVSHESKATT